MRSCEVLEEKKGFQVGPQDPRYIEAYLAMRQWHSRIIGETVVQFLNHKHLALSTGGKVRTEYWAVPTEHIPIWSAARVDCRAG